MKSSVRLLKEYVALFVEAAISPQAASKDGLALFAKQNAMVLYDPKHYSQSIEENGLENVSMDTGGIKGYIKLSPGDAGSCWGAAEVVASAAEKGYGPMMYDIAMSSIDAPIMPDRSSLSPKAAAIWQHYDKSRSDVKKMPIDDIDNPQTPDERDDGRVWDCSDYGGMPTDDSDDVDDGWDEDKPIKQCAVNKVYTGANVDSSALKSRHEEFSKKLGKQAQSFEKSLLQAADVFFDERMGG